MKILRRLKPPQGSVQKEQVRSFNTKARTECELTIKKQKVQILTAPPKRTPLSTLLPGRVFQKPYHGLIKMPHFYFC